MWLKLDHTSQSSYGGLTGLGPQALLPFPAVLNLASILQSQTVLGASTILYLFS